jgi:CBS domain-containing protein
MRHTIMTEKIARRGVRVPSEYAADFLDQVLVSEVATTDVTALTGNDDVAEVRTWLESGAPGSEHHAFPILNEDGSLRGVLTQRDVWADHADHAPLRQLLKRPPAVAFANSSLREAADLMVKEGVGRLPVVAREAPGKVIGMLTRSDLLSAHARRLSENDERHASIKLPFVHLARLTERSSTRGAR